MSRIDPERIRVFATRDEADGHAALAKVTLGKTVVEACEGGFRVGITNRRGRVTAYLASEPCSIIAPPHGLG
jgi:hypothetical protein